MPKIINFQQLPAGLREAAGFFHKAWPGQGLGSLLLAHGIKEAALANRAGFTASGPAE